MTLEQLEALCNAATPGPWAPRVRNNNAAFIAAARTMMPKLIAVAKAARNLVDAPVDDLGDLIYDQTYNLLMGALDALEQS